MKDIREKFCLYGRILDIGCGIGNFVEPLDGTYFGVDFSYDSVREHRGKHRKPVAVGDAQNLPFKENVFTFVNAVEVAQYMENHRIFVKEISRVMKNDGIAVVISPNPDSIFWIVRQKIRGKSPLNFVKLTEIIKYAKNSLLEVVYIDGIFPVPFWKTFDKFFQVFVPKFLKIYFVLFFSKSFVIVFRKKS